MKETIKNIVGVFLIVATLIVTIFGVSTALSLFVDRFFPIPEPQVNPDIVKCRELGGYLVVSGWTVQLLECKKFELK